MKPNTYLAPMELYDDLSGYNSLFVCGDIHGEFKTFLYEIKREGISDAIVLVAGGLRYRVQEAGALRAIISKTKKGTAADKLLIAFNARQSRRPGIFPT